jgi:putative transposase
VLRDHCAHARFVWNLAVEQHAHWHPGRTSAPGYLEQCRQLTQARAEYPWLAAGSQMVQQQALRDLAQAMARFFGSTHGRPSWRKAGRHEGFRIVALKPGEVRRLSRHVGEVRVPKAGWVRFRWSRAVPPGVKSYRMTRDRAGRWHVAFAAVPEPIPAPRNGLAVGIDRGVAVSAALSTDELLRVSGLGGAERTRLLRLERKLARARRGSNRRTWVKRAIARLRVRETDRRRDWAEKASTDIARRFDLIRVEDLQIKNMTRSAKGTRGRSRPECTPEGRAEPGDPAVGLGPPGASVGGEGPRPGREGQPRVYQPALQRVQARGPEVAREPSQLPMHCLRFRLPR